MHLPAISAHIFTSKSGKSFFMNKVIISSSCSSTRELHWNKAKNNEKVVHYQSCWHNTYDWQPTNINMFKTSFQINVSNVLGWRHCSWLVPDEPLAINSYHQLEFKDKTWSSLFTPGTYKYVHVIIAVQFV